MSTRSATWKFLLACISTFFTCIEQLISPSHDCSLQKYLFIYMSMTTILRKKMLKFKVQNMKCKLNEKSSETIKLIIQGMLKCGSYDFTGKQHLTGFVCLNNLLYNSTYKFLKNVK